MVMRALREKTQLIIVLVGVAFVALMVFEWGMDISGRSTGYPREVGRVNGTSVGYEEWIRARDVLLDRARQERRGRLTDQEMRELEEATWNELVMEILVQQELNRLRIGVTDAEIRAAFRTAPPPQLMSHPAFQTEGQFDFEKYREYFASPAADRQLLLQIESYYRQVLPRSKLFDEVTVGIYVTDAELWQLFRDRAEQVQAQYVMLDPRTAIPDDSVSVAPAELRRHYDQHRQAYHRPAQAEVAVANLLRQPTATDTAAALARARALRDSLAGGADFAELARRESADPGSRGEGGDLGFVRREDVVAPFGAAAFPLSVAQISQPVLSQFGYHIIQVTDRKDETVRASHILIPIELTGESEEEYLEQVDRFEGIALRRGLQAAADSVGMSVHRAVLQEGSTFLPSVGELGSAVDTDISDGGVRDMQAFPATTYTGTVLSRAPARIPPFDEVRPAVERALRVEKKKAWARARAESVVASARQGQSLEEAAAALGLQVRTTSRFTRLDFVPDLGQANAAVGTAFGLPLGSVSDAVEANDRFYILKVVERIPADRSAFQAQKEGLRAQLTLQRRQRQWELYLRELRETAKIRDFRRELFTPRT